MTNLYSDDGLFSDYQYQAFFDAELENLPTPTNFQNAFSGIPNDITFDWWMEIRHGVSVDLLDLIPEKFHKSEILRQYVQEVGVQVGQWMTQARDLILLQNPNTTSSVTYLRYLGSLIGLTLQPEDQTDEQELKKEVESAISWYRLKGTYEALNIIAMVSGLHINIYDMYSADYSHFVAVPWWTGKENENPLEPGYFKTPHFSVEVLLDQLYEKNSTQYLWYPDIGKNMISRIESIRPVHTVPHYVISLSVTTDIFGNVVETYPAIKGRAFTDIWRTSSKFFNEESSTEWEFNSGVDFNQSEETAIYSITNWQLGEGSSGIEDPSFTIENPLLTGVISVDDIHILPDKYIFEFVVPKVEHASGIIKLGLFSSESLGDLVLGATFPEIEKNTQVELRVIVTVWKKEIGV